MKTTNRERELEAEVAALRQRVAELETALADDGGAVVGLSGAGSALLQLILDTCPVGLVLVARDERILFASRRVAEILGVPREEILARGAADDFWDVQLEDGTPMPQEASLLNAVIAAGGPVFSARYSAEPCKGGACGWRCRRRRSSTGKGASRPCS